MGRVSVLCFQFQEPEFDAVKDGINLPLYCFVQ